MAEYLVTVPIVGFATVTVRANTPSEAIRLAIEHSDVEELFDKNAIDELALVGEVFDDTLCFVGSVERAVAQEVDE